MASFYRYIYGARNILFAMLNVLKIKYLWRYGL